MEVGILILTKKEIEQIRIIIAKAVEIPPDDINIILAKKDKPTLYVVDYREYNLVSGFNHIPTIEEVREDLKELYLKAKEWEMEEKGFI